MRFWIKIVVALSVVIVLGFGVWAFFFREKDDVVAYNEICELVDFKQSLGLDEKLNNLYECDYIGSGATKKVIEDDTEVKKNILSIREITMSRVNITYYDEGGNLTCVYDSYYTIENMSDDMVMFLLPYLKYTNADDRELRALRKAVDNYIDDLKLLNESIQLIGENQETILDGTDIEFEILYGKYNSFYNKYRSVLNDSANVIRLMISNIRSHVGEFKCDTEFALIDSFSRALKVSTSVETKREPLFAYDLHYVVEKYNDYKLGNNIYTIDHTEFDFLTSYNTMINNYSGVLDKVFEKHNLEKKKIADGENLSDIVKESQESLIVVMNVLGF